MLIGSEVNRVLDAQKKIPTNGNTEIPLVQRVWRVFVIGAESKYAYWYKGLYMYKNIMIGTQSVPQRCHDASFGHG